MDSDPPPPRDAAHEARVRAFVGKFGPEVPAEAANATPPDFDAQCDALLSAGPAVVSSIMGIYPPDFVAKLKERGIAWFANATTVAEAKAAAEAGADAIVAQGAEAGGHRGAFDAAKAEAEAIGLFALLPAILDAVKLPVIATGGIGDARGMAAAFAMGAAAVQIGTGFLRTPEAGSPPPGPTHWVKRRRKPRGSRALFPAVRGVRSRPSMCTPPPPRMRHCLRPIPFNARSPRRCAMPPARPMTFRASRLGRGNRRRWRKPNPRAI